MKPWPNGYEVRELHATKFDTGIKEKKRKEGKECRNKREATKGTKIKKQ